MLYVIRLFGLIAMFSSAASFSQNQEEERKYRDELENIKHFEMTTDLEKRIDDISISYHSSSFRNQVKVYKDNLNQALNIETSGDSPEDEQNILDRPMLFISSSIPLDVLRKYAKQLNEIGGGTMILRGFVGGAKKMMPTLKFISTVLNEDDQCGGPECKMYNVDIIIDPVLFDHHNVMRVPAFTVYESKTYLERCKNGESLETAKTIYGDASVRGLALELLAHDKRHTVKRFIKKARYDQ